MYPRIQFTSSGNTIVLMAFIFPRYSVLPFDTSHTQTRRNIFPKFSKIKDREMFLQTEPSKSWNKINSDVYFGDLNAINQLSLKS